MKEIKSILFLGIGGVSMHQLALSYKKLGYTVLGYDMKLSAYTEICERAGIPITTRFRSEFSEVDLCIKTGAIKDNKFVRVLTGKNIKIIDRAEALNNLCARFKCVIAVAGTHGKSTTASLIYEILRQAKFKVSCHIGADVFAPRFDITDDYLVVEACEYNKSFLSLNPDIAVVTNVEAEHMDSYKSMYNLRLSFSSFLRRASMRFAFDEECNKFLHRIKNVEFVDFTKLKLSPKIKGEYNLKNISLAIAVARKLKIDENTIIKAVNSFIGIARRDEFIGEFTNTKVFIDYAHHPTELDAFISTFAREFKDNLIVFQPHTYSRTKNFLKEFISVLSKVENLIIYKEYPAREKHASGLSAYELYREIKRTKPDVKYSASIKSTLKKLGNHDGVAFVGAGDIDKVGRKIVKIMRKKC